MIEFIIYFLAILNPFGLFIYTLPIKKELGLRQYSQVLIRASLISLAIYVFFALSGDYIFSEILKIDFASFQIFGGLVLIAMALSFIIQGKKSMITIRGDINDIAAEVAMPFIVGAGTITLSIVVGNSLGATNAFIVLGTVMIINTLIVIALAAFRQKLRPTMKQLLDRNLEILLRLSGFVVGAYGIDLVITGIRAVIN